MGPVPDRVCLRTQVRPERLLPCLRPLLFLLASVVFLAPSQASAQVSVTVSPTGINLAPNATQQFSATVFGASDTSVTWSVQEGASGGTISNSGMYAAPAVQGIYHVIARSNADNTQSATATIGLPGFVAWGLNTPREGSTATLLPSGKILFTSGDGTSNCFSNTAEVYDPASDRSTNTTGMLVPRCGHTATLLSNGKVLLAGGASIDGETATAELYDPAAGTFTATGSMNSPREGHTATLLSNGKVLIAGGVNCPNTCDSPYTTTELYDPSAGTFAPTGSMAAAHYGGTATLLSNGNVLIAGGSGPCTPSGCMNENTAEIYNPGTGTFTSTGNMLISGSEQTAALLPNGKLLFVGGLAIGEPTATAEVYDPSSGTFSQTGNLNTPRNLTTATTLPNGTVLIAGGVSLTNYPTAAEIYDPSSGTFAMTGSMHEPRIYTTATLLSDGSVVIAGGGYFVAVASTEFYNPSTGVFTSHDTFMNVDRTNQASTQLADGRILITGGFVNNGGFGLTATAEILDPASSQFTLTGSMTTGRQNHTSTLLLNGQVLVVGGFSSPASTSIAPTAELYDPLKGTFSLTGSPSVPRGGHTATLLPNGSVLIAGGQTFSPDNPGTATAEIYDPTSGTFSPTGNMTAGRYGHTATLLANGQVLIAGGVPNFFMGAAGELYNPSTGTFTPVGATIEGGGPPFALGCDCPNSTFASVLLSGGQVLVGLGNIFDPASNVFSALPNTDIADYYGLSPLPGGEVLATDGSFMVFDPASGHYSLSQPAPINRENPSAILLSTGQVLVAGGTGAYQADLYQPPVAVPAPVVASVSPNPVTGFTPVTITVQGANFSASSVVMDNFVPLQTTFISGTQLTAIFPLSSLLLAGTHTMEVVNVEDPRIAPFNLLVVNPQLQGLVSNSNGGLTNGDNIIFPNVNVGSSATLTVSFTNIGSAPLTIDSLSISGTNSADFTFGPPACSPAQGQTLAPQGVCSENIIFTPTAPGPFAATLTVNFETPGSPWVLSLLGTGVGVPLAAIAPLSLTFGNQALGTSSAPQSFTITNTGSGALVISNIEVTSGFSATNSCLSSLAPGTSCTVNVTFDPTAAGSNGGTVSVITNDGLSHVVQLTGTGFGVPMAAIAPLSLTFTSQTIGTSSAAQPVIVASTGTAALAISNIVLSDTADFQMTSNCPASMAPNTNCSLGITFVPSNVGSISGTLVVTANDGSPHTIHLSGSATGFAIAPAAGSSSSAMVTAGQPAMYQLSLQPQAFSGSVTLTCAPVTAIPDATCSASPNPVTLGGTTATVVTVSITTMTRSGSSVPYGPQRFFGPVGFKLRASHSLFYLLLSLALAGVSRRARRISLALSTVFLLGILIAGCASGGGGGTGTPPGGGGSTGTPAGTYHMRVTASGSGISSSTTLTLIVN